MNEGLLLAAYIVGSILVVAGSLLSWQCAFIWLQQRYLFFAVAYLLVLAAVAIGYRATTELAEGWIIGLVGLLIFITVSWYLHRFFRPTKFYIRVQAIYLLCCVALMSTIFWQSNQLVRAKNNNDSAEILQETTSLQTKVANTQSELSKKISSLGAKSTLLNLLDGSQNALLQAELAKEQKEQGLDFLTVVDPSGSVLARSTQATQHSDHLVDSLAWFKFGTTQSGVTLNENNAPILLTTGALGSDWLLGGVILDQSRLSNWNLPKGASLALIYPNGVLSQNSSDSQTQLLLKSKDFFALLPTLLPVSSTVQALQSDSQQYLFTALSLASPEAQDYALLILRHATLP